MRKFIRLIFFLACVGAIPAFSQKAPANQAKGNGSYRVEGNYLIICLIPGFVDFFGSIV